MTYHVGKLDNAGTTGNFNDMAHETLKINGFSAKVHRHQVSVALREPDATNAVYVTIDPATRITKTVLAGLAAEYCPNATRVTVRRVRYVSYMLRSVMKERSGSVEDCAKYALVAQGWMCESRKRDASGIY